MVDRAPIERGHRLTALPPDELADESLTDEALTTGVGFAVLAGLVDDVAGRPVDEGVGAEVRMTWPVGRWPTCPHQAASAARHAASA